MTKPGRTPCVVVGCRRTAPFEEGVIIICGKCWQLADRAARAVFRAAAKDLEAARAKATLDGDRLVFSSCEDMLAEARAEKAERAAWEAIVAQATEARAGLA